MEQAPHFEVPPIRAVGFGSRRRLCPLGRFVRLTQKFSILAICVVCELRVIIEFLVNARRTSRRCSRTWRDDILQVPGSRDTDAEIMPSKNRTKCGDNDCLGDGISSTFNAYGAENRLSDLQPTSRADWPRFRWNLECPSTPLADVRHRQGRLIARMEGLGLLTAHGSRPRNPDRGCTQIERDRRREA